MNSDQSWQAMVASTIRDVEELCNVLDLDLTAQPFTQFSLKVPRSYVDRMVRGNPKDPLLLQVLPSPEEEARASGYSEDPVGDLNARIAPGVLQKYAGRVLWMPTSSCPVHCRYCFRRHFPSEPFDQEKAFEHLEQHPEIHEVILSGGDPLMLSDARLANLFERLETTMQVQRLRIHTRMPIVVPERVGNPLLGLLARGRLQKIIVLHTNHPQEIDDQVIFACRAMKKTGAILLNQSVLLRGINDNFQTLANLSERLFSIGVLPYYLHLLDPVQGSSHFFSHPAGLMEEICAVLPGYLVPKLVREVRGERYKVFRFDSHESWFLPQT
ncbi:lysine 2,3-aminomutase [Gammaproteobacteria bacterium]